MSALPPKADIANLARYVCFVPKADIRTAAKQGQLTVRHLMTLCIAKGKYPVVALVGVIVASLAILPLLPPISQDPSYHQFADQRTLLGIPNFWNVISNPPFVLIGAMGLWQFGRDRASFVLFLGIFLTGFGSAYYHWNPNNDTLFWDRLPMALTFMAILAVAVEERVSTKTGTILLALARLVTYCSSAFADLITLRSTLRNQRRPGRSTTPSAGQPEQATLPQ